MARMPPFIVSALAIDVLVRFPKLEGPTSSTRILEDSSCRNSIRLVSFIDMKTEVKFPHSSTALSATHVTLRVLIVLNWIFGALILSLLTLSLGAAGWTWRALGLGPVSGHQGMVAAMRTIMVIGIVGPPVAYVVFSRLLRIVESVRSRVAFT